MVGLIISDMDVSSQVIHSYNELIDDSTRCMFMQQKRSAGVEMGTSIDRHKVRYPELQIHKGNIQANAKIIVDACRTYGIQISGVIKGADGHSAVTEAMLDAGCKHIASSRIEQLAKVKENHPDYPTMLLRIPQCCEIDDMLKVVDISLNSEWTTLQAINSVCEAQNLSHGVVLMMDVGDLREGWFDGKELVDVALRIENELSHIRLMGVGTNIGCYGSIKPSVTNMDLLAHWATEIERLIGRPLEIVSGGASTSLTLVLTGQMPSKINNLRVGEAILNNRDFPDLWNFVIPGLSQKTFSLKAQIIEIKDKPSYPVGELFLDAFGNLPEYTDSGIRKRAIVAMGKQDFGDHSKLICLEPGVTVLGSSSDHCLLDVTDAVKPYAIGDVLTFSMYYPAMLFLSTSPYVSKRVVETI